MTHTATATKPPADLTVIREKIDNYRNARERVREYRRNLKEWEDYVKRLEREIALAMGGSALGTIDGRDAVTYEPRDQFAHAQFLKDHPDLAMAYMVPAEPTLELDWRTLVAREPGVAGPYQTKIMKVVG